MKELLETIKRTDYGKLNHFIDEIIIKCECINLNNEPIKKMTVNNSLMSLREHEELNDLAFSKLKAVRSLKVFPEPSWNTDTAFPWFSIWPKPRINLSKLTVFNKNTIKGNSKIIQLIKPPLWPIQSQLNVCGITFIATVGSEERIFGAKLNDFERDTARQIISTIEHDIWSAIYYHLANSKPKELNPFYSLVKCYAQGIFPLGVTEGIFYYFSW